MSVSGASVTSATSEGSSSTKKGTSEKGMSETSRDSDTTLEDNEKVFIIFGIIINLNLKLQKDLRLLQSS